MFGLSYSKTILVFAIFVVAYVLVVWIWQPHPALAFLILLVIGVVVGLVVIIRVRSIAMPVDDNAAIDDLTEFRQMREEGNIDEDEFRRLKKIVSAQAIKKPTPKRPKMD